MEYTRFTIWAELAAILVQFSFSMSRILTFCNSFFAPILQSYIICNTRHVTDDWLETAIVNWGHIYMNTQYKGHKLNCETKALPKLIPESGTRIYIKFLSFQEKGERGPRHHLYNNCSVLHLIESILTATAMRIFWRVGFIIHSPDI